MARTLTSATSAAIAGPIVKPIWFVSIGYTATLYLCTRGTTVWAGESWVGVGMQPPRITYSNGGQASATINLSNGDGAFSTLILSEGVRDQDVSIWYGDADALADTDPVLMFEGVTAGGEINGVSAVSINCRSDANGMAFAPRQVIGPPVFNHVPPPGSVITWGGETVQLPSPAETLAPAAKKFLFGGW